MIRLLPGNRTLSLAVLLAAALCLLFAGMRVPDLSRPHRPKPRPRAVIGSEAKNQQAGVKKVLETAGLPPLPLACPMPLTRSAEALAACAGRGVSPLFPNASRAPPAVLS